MRLTLDSNVLVYAADLDAGDRHLRAKSLLSAASRADTVLPLQALAEFFYVTTRKRKLTVREANYAVDAWAGTFFVRPANYETVVIAMSLVETDRMAFWDAMIVAVAEQADCDLLVSEDLQDGRRFGRVTIVNPFVPQMPPILREALRLP